MSIIPSFSLRTLVAQNDLRRQAEAEARAQKLTALNEAPCLCCGATVSRLPDTPPGPIDQACIADGVVGTIAGGYGSQQHDNRIYLIALCDPCLTAARDNSRALPLGGYL